MKTFYIALIASMLLLVGCSGNNQQRFLPVSNSNVTLALDTQTGRLCLSSAKDFTGIDVRPSGGVEGMPTCYSLYSGSK